MTTAAWRVLIVEPDEIRMRHYMLELMQDSAFHLAATAPNKRRAMPLIDRTRKSRARYLKKIRTPISSLPRT